MTLIQDYLAVFTSVDNDTDHAAIADYSTTGNKLA
jgi:hypothetical protein